MNGRTNAVAGTTLPALSNPAGAGQILNGYQAIGADGSIITGTIPSRGAQTVTPGRSNQTIAAGQYLSGTQTIAGDADLVASNIRSGVSIFGVNGNVQAVEYVIGSLSTSKQDMFIIATQTDAQMVRPANLTNYSIRKNSILMFVNYGGEPETSGGCELVFRDVFGTTAFWITDDFQISS